MMELNGTYRGLSPTAESGVVCGELEVIISDETIAYRFATGLEVHSDSIERTLMRELTTSEVTDLFNEGADITGVTGHMIGETGPILLFLADAPEAPDAPGVIALRFVSEEIDGVFGPSYLWRPDQVTAGYFRRAIDAIEEEQDDPGVIPRLDNNGLRLESSTT